MLHAIIFLIFLRTRKYNLSFLGLYFADLLILLNVPINFTNICNDWLQQSKSREEWPYQRYKNLSKTTKAKILISEKY